MTEKEKPEVKKELTVFGFKKLGELIENDSALKDAMLNFKGNGFCWALSITNAIGILSAEKMTVPEIEQKQEDVVKKLLLNAAKPWQEIDTLRKEILLGKNVVPICNNTGGLRNKSIVPTVTEGLNNFLGEEVGVQIGIPKNVLNKEFPNYFSDFEEGKAYLIFENYFTGNKRTGHMVAAERKNEQILFYEPNNEGYLLKRTVNYKDDTCLLYKKDDSPPIKVYFDKKTIPLEVTEV